MTRPGQNCLCTVHPLSPVHTSEISTSTSTNSRHTHAQKWFGSWMTDSARVYPWHLCLGTGTDGIPGWLLKENADLLASPITEILNSSYCEGRLPSSWKEADKVPVLKQKPMKDISVLFHLHQSCPKLLKTISLSIMLNQPC